LCCGVSRLAKDHFKAYTMGDLKKDDPKAKAEAEAKAKAEAEQKQKEEGNGNELNDSLNRHAKDFLALLMEIGLHRDTFYSFRKFANRLLNQPVKWQKHIFDAFEALYKEVFERGVAEGLYQPGVQDFDGSKIELKEAKQFFASETEGFTNLVTLEGDYSMSCDSAFSMLEKRKSFLRQFNNTSFGSLDGFYSWVPQVSGFRQEVVLVLEILPAKSSLSDEGAIKGRERDARFKFFFSHKKKGEDWTPLGDKSKRLNRCKRLKELLEASNDKNKHQVKRHETSNQDQIKVVQSLWNGQHDQAWSSCAQCNNCRQVSCRNHQQQEAVGCTKKNPTPHHYQTFNRNRASLDAVHQ